MTSFLSKVQFVSSEAVIWTLALVFLAFNNPYHPSSLNLCPIDNLGFDFCPGCGLGQSISFLFRGEFHLSFTTHPIGAIALLILLFRIITLTKKTFTHYGKNH